MDDERHDYLAALMIGREKLFVCWLEGSPAPDGVQSSPVEALPPTAAVSEPQRDGTIVEAALRIYRIRLARQSGPAELMITNGRVREVELGRR